MNYWDERIKRVFDMVDFWNKFDIIKDSVETIDRLDDTEAYASFKRLWTLVDGLYHNIDKAERKLTSQNESRKRYNGRKIKSETYARNDRDLLADYLFNHKDYHVLFDDLEQAKEASDILWYEFDEYRYEEDDFDYENNFRGIKSWIYDNGIMEILGAHDSPGERLSFHDNYEKWYGRLY